MSDRRAKLLALANKRKHVSDDSGSSDDDKLSSKKTKR